MAHRLLFNHLSDFHARLGNQSSCLLLKIVNLSKTGVTRIGLIDIRAVIHEDMTVKFNRCPTGGKCLMAKLNEGLAM